MTKEEANKLLSEKVQAAYAALAEAQVLADKHGLMFDFSPAYGMGGSYMSKEYYKEEYDSSDAAEESYGWQASSQSC